MSLVTTQTMFRKAMEEGYGIGAFNVNCLEMALPLIQAAEQERAPLILQFGQRYLDFISPEVFMPYVAALARGVSVPIAIHLDHSHDLGQNIRCLRAGFTSLMFDGSSLPLDENARLAAEVAKMAHACGIPVEGEVGAVTIYNETTGYTPTALSDPDEVVKFIEASGVDSVAVSVGNMHKMPVKEARIDIPLIREIRRRASIPLVMHGSTGISDEDLVKAIKAGITKVNIATEFNRAFLSGIKQSLSERPKNDFPMEYITEGMLAVKRLAVDKLRLTGSSGKA
ncbi:class II fructose-bisphosphate aldolase [Mahella australiensis]|uniref:Ketose-bisphosphate aldolase n=1 Tax=Mahella australiensis (strain DSM 15567 / CIP 107919 / 50-1 BON) TaxID=697281 RepID=F3ZZ61_MAHA5|nr:class II fructose-bisphosphate aldolase [Mahella australiensis]AEE97843.1 ketose-bisphosphate aldolase [Mahella australiensis 50-1 BON]